MRSILDIYSRKFIYKEVNRKINFHWNPWEFERISRENFFPIFPLQHSFDNKLWEWEIFYNLLFYIVKHENALRGIGKLWKICFDFATFEAKLCAYTCWYVYPQICVLDLQTFPRIPRNTKLRYSHIFSLKTIAIRSVLEITTMWMMWCFCFEKK
mgnify:CR=1 FL=1